MIARQNNYYLPHVDGLRGLAIFSVLLFHLDVVLFSGGFVGVDIFFVISGYLITSHIRAQLEAGNFSLLRFYARRARRLLPALTVTLLLTLMAACFILSAPRLEMLAAHTLQSLFSVANVFFWLESGYFDSDAAMKPLLHMWSLSLEEQFYLVWPLYLLLLAGFWRSATLLLPAIISLLTAQYWLSTDPAAAFFLMPFRICEFALGALAFYWQQRQIPGQAGKEAVSIVGLVLIGLPVFCYDQTTLFPGLAAMVPALGTALIIHSGQGTRLAALLSSRLILGLGLISYSTYLLHWPLIVLYKDALVPVLDVRAQFTIFSLTVVGGWLMYRFVETPFRKQAKGIFKIPGTSLAAALLIMALLISIFSVWIIRIEGWPSRFAVMQLTQSQIQQGMEERYSFYRARCERGEGMVCNKKSDLLQDNVLILGDSHAPDSLTMFLSAYPDKHYVMNTLPGGCPPIMADDSHILSPIHPNRQQCIEHNLKLLESDYLNQFGQVVISVYYEWYKPAHLVRTVDHIKSVSNAEVIVLGNYIALNRPMAELINQQIDILQEPEFVRSFALYEEELRAAAEGRYLFISKRDLLCSAKVIESCKVFIDRKPFSYDQHHLSLEASLYIGKRLLQVYPDFPRRASEH